VHLNREIFTSVDVLEEERELRSAILTPPNTGWTKGTLRIFENPLPNREASVRSRGNSGMKSGIVINIRDFPCLAYR